MIRGIFAKPSETASAIASHMGIPLWNKKNYPITAAQYVRWGTVAKGPVGIVYNKADAIRLTSHKKNCRSFLFKKSIATPIFTETLFPIVARPIHHTHGNNFFYCEAELELLWAKWKGAQYFSHYYPKKNEYRVHIGNGKVLLYSEKYGPKETTKNWNYDAGFRFHHLPRSHWRKEIIDIATKAVQATGLDFGAVDVMSDPIEKQFPPVVICEINTAPALSPYGIAQYAKYFHKILHS